MVKIINFFSAWTPELLKDGDILTITDEGEAKEIVDQTTNKVKIKLSLNLEDSSGNIKSFMPNDSNLRALNDAFGEDSKDWVGKQVTVEKVKYNLRGTIKTGIYLKPKV